MKKKLLFVFFIASLSLNSCSKLDPFKFTLACKGNEEAYNPTEKTKRIYPKIYTFEFSDKHDLLPFSNEPKCDKWDNDFITCQGKAIGTPSYLVIFLLNRKTGILKYYLMYPVIPNQTQNDLFFEGQCERFYFNKI